MARSHVANWAEARRPVYREAPTTAGNIILGIFLYPSTAVEKVSANK